MNRIHNSNPIDHLLHPIAPDAAITRIVLVRHGRTTFNDQQRYQGSCDQPLLTEVGRSQAQQVGNALRAVPIHAIYASPLQRVRQTLDEIKARLKCLDNQCFIATNALLREIDLPAWEGCFYDEIRDRFPDDYHRWKHRPHEFYMAIAPKSGQLSVSRQRTAIQHSPTPLFPVRELYNRAHAFWQILLPYHRGQTVLVVAHSGTNQALIGTALGLSATHYHRLQQCNGSISLLDIPNQHLPSAQLRLLNSAQHLQPNLPKLKEGKQGLRLLLLPMPSENAKAVSGVADQLAQVLQSTAIQFGITNDDRRSFLTLLRGDRPFRHPVTLLASDQIAEAWTTAVRAHWDSLNSPSRPLITGIVVAPPIIIQHIITEAIAPDTAVVQQLALQPATLSILHYPGYHHPPILQVLNLQFGAEMSS
jgi:probable phosphoglycerate mutase